VNHTVNRKRFGTYDSNRNFLHTIQRSILDVTSSGYIERDQQAKKNSYNYNYWSSPVSLIQGSVNNMPYIIKVLKDGKISTVPN
jgi:hypothetical protein